MWGCSCEGKLCCIEIIKTHSKIDLGGKSQSEGDQPLSPPLNETLHMQIYFIDDHLEIIHDLFFRKARPLATES